MAEHFCNLMRGLAKAYRAPAASRRSVDFTLTAAE
jgi:hypothetical protein